MDSNEKLIELIETLTQHLEESNALQERIIQALLEINNTLYHSRGG